MSKRTPPEQLTSARKCVLPLHGARTHSLNEKWPHERNSFMQQHPGSLQQLHHQRGLSVKRPWTAPKVLAWQYKPQSAEMQTSQQLACASLESTANSAPHWTKLSARPLLATHGSSAVKMVQTRLQISLQRLIWNPTGRTPWEAFPGVLDTLTQTSAPGWVCFDQECAV